MSSVLDEISAVRVEQVAVDKILRLRRDVFNPDKEIDCYHLPEDDWPMTRHFTAYAEEYKCFRPVSCGSFYSGTFRSQCAWFLQNMATEERFRRKGFGSALLEHAQRALLEELPDRRLFYCYARLSAIQFYESCGWMSAGKEFFIPDSGWHILMHRRFER